VYYLLVNGSALLLLLFIAAWSKFNTPPTNRSGTTFALFFFGVIFYYALILALWVLVSFSGIGFGRFGNADQFAQYAPIFAALIVVVASQFSQVEGDRRNESRPGHSTLRKVHSRG
jgi:uncharacterized membrane protein required for colicin V production